MANRFSGRYEPRQRFTEIHSRTPPLSKTLFLDNFVKLTVIFVLLFHKTVFRNSLDNNLLNANHKKNLQSNAHVALGHLL